MNKAELIANVAERTEMTKKSVQCVVDATIEAVLTELGNGNDIAIPGFGTFSVRERAAREGYNPATKEKIAIAACKVPVFKAGKAMKDAVK